MRTMPTYSVSKLPLPRRKLLTVMSRPPSQTRSGDVRRRRRKPLRAVARPRASPPNLIAAACCATPHSISRPSFPSRPSSTSGTNGLVFRLYNSICPVVMQQVSCRFGRHLATDANGTPTSCRTRRPAPHGSRSTLCGRRGRHPRRGRLHWPRHRSDNYM